MIERKKLVATQVVACAPWQIPAEALDTKAVQKAVEDIKNGVRSPQAQVGEQQQPLFSGL